MVTCRPSECPVAIFLLKFLLKYVLRLTPSPASLSNPLAQSSVFFMTSSDFANCIHNIMQFWLHRLWRRKCSLFFLTVITKIVSQKPLHLCSAVSFNSAFCNPARNVLKVKNVKSSPPNFIYLFVCF